MELNKNNSTEVIFNQIEKETEKAVLVNLPVSWNCNMHTKSFWFPKSCIIFHNQTMSIATFLVEKLERENAFHGFEMRFEVARAI